MYQEHTILLIESNQEHVAQIRCLLANSKYSNTPLLIRPICQYTENLAKGLEGLIVLVEVERIDPFTLQTLRDIIHYYEHCAIVVIADFEEEEIVLDILEEGAQYCLSKNKLTELLLERVIDFSKEKNSAILKLNKANASLQLSEQHFSKLFFNNQFVALALSTYEEGKFVLINNIFLERLGFTEKEVIGKTIQELNLWLEPNKRDEFAFRIKNGEIIKNERIKVQTKSGKILDLLFSMDVFQMDTGSMILSVAEDITDQVEAERKLHQSERSLDTLINSYPDPIWLVNKEYQLAIANHAFFESIKKAYGIDMKLGDHIFIDKLTQEVRTKWEALYQRAFNGETFTVSNQAVNHQLIYKDIELTFNPAYDENQKVMGIGCFSRDITERIKTEQKFIESESRYRSLVEQALDAIFISNQQGQYIDVNESACRLLDYSREELLMLGSKDILFSEEKNQILSKRYEKLKKGKSDILELQLKRKDGTTVDVESNAWMLPDELFVAIVRDITERKRAEKTEAEIQQRLKAIFDGTRDAILLADESGSFVQFNPAALVLLGYTEQELLGKKVVDILSVENPPVLWNEFIEEGHQVGLIELVKKSGEVIICHYNATADILPGLHLSILTNITERKQAEDKLRKSEAGLAEAQRLAQYGNWEYVLATDKLTWSEELYRVFATDRETFIENHGSFLHLVDEEDRDFAFQTSLRIQKNGKPFDIDYRITTRDGEKRVINERGYAERNADGKIIRLFGTAQNITARKKAEEEIKSYSQHLRELTAHLQSIREEERTRIAREIHDELGQQLTGLKMNASWVSKEIKQEDKSVRDKLSDMVLLIDETVKTVRRISTELRPGILDDLGLVPALEWQSQEFEKRTGIKSLFYTEHTDLNLTKTLASNIFRIYQEALTNVMRHAKATLIETLLKEKEGSLCLVIKDNGQGFDLEEAKNKKSWGLIGMKERVSQFQGELIIESQKQNGTSITLKVSVIKDKEL